MHKAKILLSIVAMGSLFVFSAPSAKAEKAGQLTQGLMQALASAQKLKGPQIDQSTFKDKPVFIVFFASW